MTDTNGAAKGLKPGTTWVVGGQEYELSADGKRWIALPWLKRETRREEYEDDPEDFTPGALPAGDPT